MYTLVDSKEGPKAGFESLDDAKNALLDWVKKQRGAGEPVTQPAEGVWADSRVRIWITAPDGSLVSVEESPGS